MKDTIEITSLQRTLSKALKMDCPVVIIHYTLHLYSRQNCWFQCVLYEEYVHACHLLIWCTKDTF